ncbi:hypothetical protein [Rhodoferax sp.]|uniref:hypothetical protein n=1 Tax=Rhodoferax sp. TaxID=50421 RepID=UPI00284091B0|nr:hypothetical protein [Rhodoferax sp.]MDR3368469.1 hypothetical protein [Rhodoferax sp.]
MSEISSQDASNSAVLAAAATGIARRKLLRAGLAAGPVMLALKSQSALACGTGGDHLQCSVWASLSAAKGCMKSHAPVPGKSCNSYKDWAANTSNMYCNFKFHSATNNNVPFDDTCFRDSSFSSNKYHSLRNVCAGTKSDGKTTFTIADDLRKQLLGKHCAAMWLNYQVDNSPISDAQCKAIWTACRDGKGTWTPTPGATPWDREQCIAYFEYICNGTPPTAWTGNFACKVV